MWSKNVDDTFRAGLRWLRASCAFDWWLSTLIFANHKSPRRTCSRRGIELMIPADLVGRCLSVFPLASPSPSPSVLSKCMHTHRPPRERAWTWYSVRVVVELAVNISFEEWMVWTGHLQKTWKLNCNLLLLCIAVLPLIFLQGK